MSESNQDADEIESTEHDEDEDDDDFEDADDSDDSDDADDVEANVAERGPARAAKRAPVAADERSREALAFTTDVIVKMGMDCDVSLQGSDDESTDIHIHVTGPDAGRIIGKKGQVLAAVQFIVNRAMNRPGLERRYVSVDADGYRSRREDSLASMARRLGKQAVSDGQIITFEPMSPRDRRVVHLALAKFEGVVTRSEGEGDDRRVQIIPVRRG
jgi:spoIIIJ-associated protein